MIVSVENFNTYTGNCETQPAIVEMKKEYLKTAEELVVSYLGFNPVESQRSQTLSGIGSDRIYPYAYNITDVDSLTVNGVEISDYEINETYIRLPDGVFPTGINNVAITYTAGWDDDSMPSTIKMTIMQIASLMMEESEGNIGVTGKSFGDNSRSFINYTNFDKWLNKLSKYKVFRME